MTTNSNLFKKFTAIMAVIAVVLVSFTSCSDPLHDVDIDTPTVVVPSDNKITDVEKTDCKFVADSVQKTKIAEGLLEISEESAMKVFVEFHRGEVRGDSSKVYNVKNGVSVSNFHAAQVKDVKTIAGKKLTMEDNKFVVGETTMGVSFAETFVPTVNFEKFELTADNEVSYLKLCFVSMTGEGFLKFGTPVKVEGSETAYTVPAELIFPKSEGDSLVYKYNMIATAEPVATEDIPTFGDPVFDGEGNVSIDVIGNNPFVFTEKVATIVAEEIPAFVAKEYGISLKSAKELMYTMAKVYPFDFEKFVAKFMASYKMSVTIVYNGKEYVRELPSAVVALTNVSEPAVSTIDNGKMYDYTLSAAILANNTNKDVIAKTNVHAIVMVENAGEEPDPTPGDDNLHVVVTDNGDNTGKIELVNEDNKVVKTWNNIPLGLAISVVRSREFTNENMTLSLNSSKPGNWVSEGETYNSGNGVTAEKMNRTDVFTFSHFTENAVVSAYRNFKVTFDGKEYNADFNSNVNSAVNVTKGDLTNNGNKAIQEWNNTYSASNGKSTVTANQIVKIGFEKQDVITGWDFTREEINRQENDLVRNIFGIERHSDSANDRETQVDRNVNLVITNNGTIKVYKDFTFNGNGSESSKTSSINEGDFVGSRSTTVKSYSFADATAQVTVALDNVMSYKGVSLQTIVYSISSELNEVSSSKEGIYKVTVYELVHSIIVNGETFNSVQRVEKYILDMDYTIPGYEVDPEYAATAARTKIFEGNRDNNYEVDCIIFRSINNHADKKFVGFFVGSSKRVEFDNNFSMPSRELISLVINASGNWEPADLYAQKGSLDASKDYLNGYKYKSILNGSDAYNTFSTTTMGGLEKYGNPLIAKMVQHEGYYSIVDMNYK